ncbi:MlaD family protein [Desulfogranum mediterraneum]|uniref:MlaD family protein n=1 Tax=Desulfogranum mediterraneum TaxID=160661 RepID=UPI000411C4F8|nr:MlaD family protein [Desulfogranum mediterraneum]
MSKKANPTLVGSFVLVAIGLALAAIIILGNIKLENKVFPCVLYFPGSLHGLDIGAPVTLRGVRIGTVSRILINFNPRRSDYTIAVYIEVSPNSSIREDPAEPWDQVALAQTTRTMIAKGLRGKLKMRSLVTGKLYIDLAFYPGSELSLHHPDSDPETVEIPTLPSGLEQLTQTLADLPIGQLAKQAGAVLAGLDRILNSNKSKQAQEQVYSSLANLDLLLQELQTTLPASSRQLSEVLTALKQLAREGSSLLKAADATLELAGPKIIHSLEGVDQSVATLLQSLENIQSLVDDGQEYAYDFSRTMRELEAMARSIRFLTDYLQRYPNALIFGPGEETP